MAWYRIADTLNPLNSVSGGSRTTDGAFQGQSQSPITTSVYLSLEVGSGSIAACRDEYGPDMVHTEYTILLGENVNIPLFEQYLRGIKWMKNIDSDDVKNDLIKHYGNRIVFTDNDGDQGDVEGYHYDDGDDDDGNYFLLRFFVHTNDDMDYAELTKAVRHFEDDEKLDKDVWRSSRAVMRRCQQVCKDGFDEGLMIVLQAELDVEVEAKQRADQEAAWDAQSGVINDSEPETIAGITAPPAKAKYKPNSRRNALIISRWKAHHHSCRLDSSTLDDLIDWWEMLPDDEKSENRVPKADWSFNDGDGSDSRARDKIRKAINRSLG